MRKFIGFIVFILFNFIHAQNGKIISRKMIQLKEESFWNGIAPNDTIKPQYAYLYELNFFQFTYQSDSFEVKGFMIEPKTEGQFPVIIFNRGGNRGFSSFIHRNIN